MNCHDGSGCSMQQNKQRDRYLTLVPRGLELFVIRNIKSQIANGGYTCCWISEIGPSLLEQLNTGQNEDVDPLECMAARIEYSKYKKKMKKRKKEKSNTSQAKGDQHELLCQTATFDEFISNNPDLIRITGSIEVPELGSHASLGYHTTKNHVEKTLSL